MLVQDDDNGLEDYDLEKGHRSVSALFSEFA